MSENMEPGAPEFQAKKGNGRKALADTTAPMPPKGNDAAPDNVVPMPVKKEGLTLASLSRATVKSGTTPLTATATSLVTIEVTKPTKGVPFQAHPGEAFSMEGYSLTTKKPGVIGDLVRLLDPSIAEMILPHVRYQRFCLCWDAWQAKPFIWPINIQVEGDRANGWTVSANRIWTAAKNDWVVMVPGNGAYLLGKPVAKVEGEPNWPVQSFPELMLMAFRDLYIGADDREHPEIVKRMITIVPE